MKIVLEFTPEEFKEYQVKMHQAELYSTVVKQRDEVAIKFANLQDAITDAGFALTTHCDTHTHVYDTYSLHKLDKELEEFYKKYPNKNYLKPYQESYNE